MISRKATIIHLEIDNDLEDYEQYKLSQLEKLRKQHSNFIKKSKGHLNEGGLQTGIGSEIQTQRSFQLMKSFQAGGWFNNLLSSLINRSSKTERELPKYNSEQS